MYFRFAELSTVRNNYFIIVSVKEVKKRLKLGYI